MVRNFVDAGASHAINTDRLDYVFDLLQAQILKPGVEFTSDMIKYRARNANTPWNCYSLQPRSDVDTIAINIISINDDIAQVNSNPK